MLNIRINTVPDDQQRYNTVGDYYLNEKSIDAFDLKYQGNRKAGDVSEPGDSSDAPYFHEHQFANKIERMLAEELDV